MLSEIVNVVIVVACMTAAGFCMRYSLSAFKQEGKIPLNVYDLLNDGKKKDLAQMDDALRKKTYRTAGFVFMGFAVALLFLMMGFLMQMFGKSGETCFFIAMGVEVIEIIAIAFLIHRK